ncbi:hypothetical protein [Sphingomonas jeddahensis]|uniref:Uncharacterized protein n=1 Tax=Sphingomonas jeddahensis TaxID=1915074 RepID=A0A1V2ERX7_9SPHN|nr:hypothetical protein [Sphingomonas jeddahensis]ONF95426.1 hypothetical protein SPHI_23230 [Sphingomonas jeddahensis]
MRTLVSTLALGLALAACSSEPEQPDDTLPANITQDVPPVAETPAPASSTSPTTQPSPSLVATPVSGKTLALEGLGDLRIGEAVPRGSNWAERGGQIPGGCRTVSSPDFPGAYAIVTEGKVRRITVGQRSDVKLVEGIGVGSTESDVKKWFGGFREEPHKYEDKPAKYLTAPNAASGDPALRFEIGADRKVSLMHVGTMPVLGYVEGCA